jgi:hypothetical protein
MDHRKRNAKKGEKSRLMERNIGDCSFLFGSYKKETDVFNDKP